MWRTARVFISSTFLDMQAERDYLVRFVFSRLREELLKFNIHFVDVDLRWGVTSEQDALATCLQYIDECQPRFLCMLGGRYGWTPDGHEDSITAQEIVYGAVNRPQNRQHHFFYFRDDTSTESMIEPYPSAYREIEGSANAKKLAVLKQTIVDAGYAPYFYTPRWDDQQKRLIHLEAFGERVYQDLRASIEAEIGLSLPSILDEYSSEDLAMEAFVETRTANYVIGERQFVLDQLFAHATAEDLTQTSCLVGESGSGKSALLGQFHRSYMPRLAAMKNTLVISHFVGASAASTSAAEMLRRLLHKMMTTMNIIRSIPLAYEELCDAFVEILGEIAEQQVRVILVIDAINQLDITAGTPPLRWLPQTLPDNVRIILSCLPGMTLNALQKRESPPIEIALKPLSELDASAIIDGFLSRYNKQLDVFQRESLLSKKDAIHPLYLLVALEELRTVGSFQITEYIQQLPEDTQSLFRWILQRLETEPGFRDEQDHLIGETLVRRYFTYLACGRYGMQQKELIDLVAPGDPFGNIAALQRLVRPYLVLRGTLLSFFHDQFRLAVDSVYLDEADERHNAHQDLGTYFHKQATPFGRNSSPRALSEMTYHFVQDKQIKVLQMLYRDLSFMDAMCQLVNVRTTGTTAVLYDGILELLNRLEETLQIIPSDEQTEFRVLFKLLSERTQLLRIFPQALGQELCNYLDLMSSSMQELIQQAQHRIQEGLHLTEKKHPYPRVRGHSAEVTAISVAPEGGHFITGAADGSIGYWHIDELDPRWLISPHKSWVASVSLSPNGKRALSISNDGTSYLWDMDLGVRVSHLIPMKSEVIHWFGGDFCAFADNETALITRRNRTTKIDLATENRLWESIELRYDGDRQLGDASKLDFAPLAKRIIAVHVASKSDDKTDIRLGDTETGATIFTVELPGSIALIAIAPDGNRALAADMQGRLTGFDFENQSQFKARVDPRLMCLCNSSRHDRFYGYNQDWNIVEIALGHRISFKQISIPDNPYIYHFANTMACLPDGKHLLIGYTTGDIILVEIESGKICQRWPADLSLVRAAIFAWGRGSAGIEGVREADTRTIMEGDNLTYINATGQRHSIKPTEHSDRISGITTLSRDRILTVDKRGTAVIWQGEKAVRMQTLSGTGFLSCSEWLGTDLGVVGTEDEQIVIIGKKIPESFEFVSTGFEFKAGITTLAAVGEPMCILAGYFNGMVHYRGKGVEWTGPRDQRHNLYWTATALNPDCTFAAAGNILGEVMIWRCENGVLESEFSLHDGTVVALAFGANTLYSVGVDRAIYGIDLVTSQIKSATVMPITPIAIRVEHEQVVFALDTNGNIYRFTTDRRNVLSNSPPPRRNLLQRVLRKGV